MVNIGFAHCSKQARLGTTRGSGLKHNKDVGNFSTNMRVLSSKDGNSLSYFDRINETQAETNNISLKHMFTDNHEEVNRGKIKGQLSLEHMFGFCRTFKKITKNLSFNITLKTANLQDIIPSTIGDANNIEINFLCLFLPLYIQIPETQAIFTESIKKFCTI